MSSLAENEAAKRHSHAPPPPPPPPPIPPPPPLAQPWHAPPFAPPPPPHHIPQPRAHETVINGTTWYHHAPSPLSSDSHFLPPSSSSRYANPPPFHSVNFDPSSRSHPSPHRHPHGFPPPGGPFANRGIFPAHGVPYDLIPAYSRDDGMHDAVARGYTFVGADSRYGIVPGYQYNEQHPYYPYDGHREPYMPNPVHVYGTMPSPIRVHGVLQTSARGNGFMPRAPASYGAYAGYYGSNAPYGTPPQAIRTSGKTFRQAVTWCGMTMPVTITSQAAAVVEWIQRQTGDLFGFDLEWKPNRLKGEDNLVALLQICGPADCLIVQLLYTDMIPKLLKEFLSNSQKCLGGVGIRQDVKKLERDHDLVCQGQVELGTLASEKLKRDDLQGTGLKKLVDQVLGMTLVKIKKITMSNWEKEYLDEKQIEYACIDAWAAFAILQKLAAL